MLHKSKEHLEYVNESYLAHFSFAAKMAYLCFKAGFATIIHAVCPAVLQTTGSRTINHMHQLMAERIAKYNGKT